MHDHASFKNSHRQVYLLSLGLLALIERKVT